MLVGIIIVVVAMVIIIIWYYLFIVIVIIGWMVWYEIIYAGKRYDIEMVVVWEVRWWGVDGILIKTRNERGFEEWNNHTMSCLDDDEPG